METLYDRQMKWKKTSNEKVEKVRASSSSEAYHDPPGSTYAPSHSVAGGSHYKSQSHSSNISNSHSQSSNISASTNNKKVMNDMAKSNPVQRETDMTPKVVSNANESKYKAADIRISPPVAPTNESRDVPQYELREIDASAEEPLVEVIERERRQWHEERMELLKCIHMQQVELNQRSIAAHERATEIAKELAKTIELFDARLFAVENSSKDQSNQSSLILKSLADLTAKISLNLTHKTTP